MFKIIIGITLILVSLLPPISNKEVWEYSLREKIDESKEVVTQAEYSFIPSEIKKIDKASVTAKSAYFVDKKSGKILLDKNSDIRMPAASISKLMTAIIVVEKLKLSETIKVPRLKTRTGDAVMGLKAGEQLKVTELLHGLLLVSGSDAAITLANYVAGSEEEFVALMNERAILLGLNNTQFTNPVGWDESGNYSTSKDLTSIAEIALSNPTIARIVAKKSYLARNITGRKYILTNTNHLLNKNYLGIKTGTTYKAGECLATYYKDENREIIGVVLNSPNRFQETERIITLIKNSYNFR